MDSEVDGFLDITVMILLVALFMTTFIPFCVLMYSGNFGGFNTQLEKTAETTSGVIYEHDTNINQGDVLMLIAIADKYEPSPKKLNINGTTLNLQDTTVTDGQGNSSTYGFEANRVAIINAAYAALDWTKSGGKLVTAVGPDGIKEWRYIYNG